MPKITIDGRELEVAAGTNLVDAAAEVGIQIPHYCYHPRLSIVGQCRMCMVEIEGMPKLQAACSTQVTRDGLVVRTDSPAVQEAQRAVMEFLLINHPLDCPICDQAGECGLQDYSFKHGQGFSRFRFEEKRIYPEKERIPLGPTVLLNMNRCIHCTRCVRFTQEITKTGELGFFERGAHAEIGVFPGRRLDNPLSTCVVDLCPVGALTSTQFRFAERVWYLEKKPGICMGCDVGCNVTLEHRRGKIRRVKPRFNPHVNDYWMCDFGRTFFERWQTVPRLRTPRVLRANHQEATSWKEALDLLFQRLRSRSTEGVQAILGSGWLSTEEAFLLVQIANLIGTPHRSVWVDTGPVRSIPNLSGGVSGSEAAPNRRGAELVGLVRGKGGLDAEKILLEDRARDCAVLLVADSDFGRPAWDARLVERLRQARFLIVMGWAESPLAQVADLVLPLATPVEREGTMVNSQWRLQRFERVAAPPLEVRTLLEVAVELLSRWDVSWKGNGVSEVFQRMASSIPQFGNLNWNRIPATGVQLEPQFAEASA
jgi:NADH-quinone oxidoreductase subunit G